MALAARKDWLDRALTRAASQSETLEEVAHGITALALAPVKPEPYYAPIDPAAAETLVVDIEPMELAVSSPEEFVRVREYVWHVRQQMVNPTDHGRTIQVTAFVLVGHETKRVIFRGTEAAIRQALPDQETIASWQRAGAVEAPTWDLTQGAEGTVRTLHWVPLDQLPTILQMEYRSRAEQADVSVTQ